MICAGTDLKFKVTSLLSDFSLKDDEFSIEVRNRWGRVIAKVPKGECFRDSEDNYYFTLEKVNEGVYDAVFRGYMSDDDYMKKKAAIVDCQRLITVGQCDSGIRQSRGCGCCDNAVRYELVWTANLDDGGGTPDPGPGPATKDYYIGWASGTKRAFSGKTAQELVAGATAYSIGSAAYSQQCQDIIFYILFRESNPPTGQLDSSGVVSPITAADFLAGGDCPHDPVEVDGITYKVWGTRNTDYPTGNNVITINF